MRLPSAYQEVEYIESSGTQWIDTGWISSETTTIISKINLQTNSSADQVIWGTSDISQWTWTTGYFAFVSTSLGLQIGKGESGRNTYFNDFTRFADHIVELGNTYAILDGQSKSLSSGLDRQYNVSLFQGNGKSGTLRMYYFKIYDSGALVRNMIPCYRKSDDVIGLYDTVNNTFYTNSGTGTFTKGANVEYPPEYKLHGAIQTFHFKPKVEGYLNKNTIAYYPLTEDLLDHKDNGEVSIDLSASGSGYSFGANGAGQAGVQLTGDTYFSPGSGNVWGKHPGTDDMTIAFRVSNFTSPSYGTYGVSGYHSGILSFNSTFKTGVGSDGVVGRGVGLLDLGYEGFPGETGYSTDDSGNPITVTTPLVSGLSMGQTYQSSFLSVVDTFSQGHHTRYISSEGFGVEYPYYESNYGGGKTVSTNCIGKDTYSSSNYRYFHGFMRDFVVAGDVWTKDMIKAYFNEDLGGNSSSGGGGSTSGAAIQ